MSITELSGVAFDENCLHCVLAPFIDKFRTEHPEKSGTQLLGELADVVGELIASGLYNDGQQDQLARLIQFVSETATEKAQMMFASLEWHAPRRQR